MCHSKVGTVVRSCDTGGGSCPTLTVTTMTTTSVLLPRKTSAKKLSLARLLALLDARQSGPGIELSVHVDRVLDIGAIVGKWVVSLTGEE